MILRKWPQSSNIGTTSGTRVSDTKIVTIPTIFELQSSSFKYNFIDKLSTILAIQTLDHCYIIDFLEQYISKISKKLKNIYIYYKIGNLMQKSEIYI